MERRAMDGNRMDPFQRQAALYLQGRAYEALGQADDARETYGRLLSRTGPGIEGLLYLGDAPERLEALREGGTAGADTGG
jgi:hypothetical protein